MAHPAQLSILSKHCLAPESAYTVPAAHMGSLVLLILINLLEYSFLKDSFIYFLGIIDKVGVL